MLIVGTEWLIDAAGCRAEALGDVETLRAVFRRAVAELDLRVVGEAQWHKFPPPGGVTGLALLSESHLACHTYPEFGVATFNLYCCRARPAWPWAERLGEMLGATRVTVRVVERPLSSDSRLTIIHSQAALALEGVEG
ncbi:MAG: adenosylmethionine decarboxylase [Pyrinomonadaceae bacterium]